MHKSSKLRGSTVVELNLEKWCPLAQLAQPVSGHRGRYHEQMWPNLWMHEVNTTNQMIPLVGLEAFKRRSEGCDENKKSRCTSSRLQARAARWTIVWTVLPRPISSAKIQLRLCRAMVCKYRVPFNWYPFSLRFWSSKKSCPITGCSLANSGPGSTLE